MSAPAANAFSLPVRIAQAMLGSASNPSIAAVSSSLTAGVERVERLRPVEAEDADLALVSTMRFRRS